MKHLHRVTASLVPSPYFPSDSYSEEEIGPGGRSRQLSIRHNPRDFDVRGVRGSKMIVQSYVTVFYTANQLGVPCGLHVYMLRLAAFICNDS